MIALYIFAALILIIFLLLISTVTLTVSFDERFSVFVGFWGFKINLTKEKSHKHGKEEKQKNENAGLAYLKGRSFTESVRKTAELLKQVLPEVKKLLSHIRVRALKLFVRVADFDAAKTAVEYGAVSAAVYNLLAWLESFMDLSVKEINIISAFGEQNPSAKLYLKLKARVITLLCTAFRLFVIYRNFTEESVNERQKHSVNN